MERVNVGCGRTPTPGWLNFDNSWTVRIARVPGLTGLLARAGILGEQQVSLATVAREEGIRYGDAADGLPLADGSVEVLYSSHMLEHLDREREVPGFLEEARRVLCEGGVIRLAVPDLRQFVEEYVGTGDADRFVERTLLACERHETLLARLQFLLVGHRHHLWMYDGESLRELLSEAGFSETVVLSPGETKIPDPGPLDLHERADESVYVEAVNG